MTALDLEEPTAALSIADQPVNDEGKSRTYSGAPPPFGHALLRYFSFAPGYVNLNHGSYGSLPLPVHDACEVLSAEVERNPDRFHRETYRPRLDVVRERLATLLGAAPEECVVVQNASYGLNVVLRNFEWRAGDVMIGASTTYGSIVKTFQYLHDIYPETILAPFHLEFPTSHADILSYFRAHLRALPAPAPSAANPAPQRVAVIDALVSAPGALLPWEEMVAICREEGVYSVVDAAHAVGQQTGINLTKSMPDFWVSNCHKWLFAKRGCAVLYVPERNRHLIKSTFPTGFEYAKKPSVHDWVAQFDWPGTIDFVPFLSVAAALDFRVWLGGEEKINAHCHALALDGGARMAEILGTDLMAHSHEIALNMVNVALPLPADTSSGARYALVNRALSDRQMDEFGCYAKQFVHGGRWWVRASAQVFNELADFEHVGKALKTICGDLRQELEDLDKKQTVGHDNAQVDVSV